MTDIVLDVEVRENTGTGGARAARRAGLVPGVLYGGGQDPVAISLKFNEVVRALNSGNLISSLVEISHKGKKQKALTKDIQFHPVKDLPWHIDFYRVKSDSIITVEVSIHVVGEEESPGLKRGGALNIVRHTIEVNCPAGDIPESLDVDVSGLEIGDSIHESELNYPKGVSPAITDRDPTVLTVAASRTETKNDEEDVVEGEEGEGEATEDTEGEA
ncbi:MAG TPA: 50S ribosomal protein L25/general stress protein Ctc [Hellea balneolensis]|uniref:Large ribosomal subunit protein bL25 n=1 Tax=Hellea balneolensis TaxID=287478 RepID=A0A7C5R0D0_9PROT|nr:50S ribosomal protein L25/general stress protein Ctc [Hellea balneolensis]